MKKLEVLNTKILR